MRLKRSVGVVSLVFLLTMCGYCHAGPPLKEPPHEGKDPFNEFLKFGQGPQSASSSKAAPLRLENIAPLYTEPKLPDEGVWLTEDAPKTAGGLPLLYRTVYRPSERFPTSVVHMMLLDMRHLTIRMYLGTSETGGSRTTASIDKADHSRLVAVTNALWQTRHAGRVGLIHRGKVLKKPTPGRATIIGYTDGTVDIREWSDNIPIEKVWDARQLKHLIVKDGKVVREITKRGRTYSAEIGLGSLLNEDLPVLKSPEKNEKGRPIYRLNLTQGPLWFLATRSAFGIRPDGSLVFAIGRHIRTLDLAKALVLAGCVRGMHGDANPGNVVGIVYHTGEAGKIVKRAALSPYQHKSTLNRYLTRSYPKDFFAFFTKGDGTALVADESVGKEKDKKLP